MSKTLKEKLQQVLREQLAEQGPSIALILNAEVGYYLMREDGQLVGIGDYQQIQPKDGVKTIEDLELDELARSMADLATLEEYASDGYRRTTLTGTARITADLMSWARGEREDAQLGARPCIDGNSQKNKKPFHWNDDTVELAKLSKEVSLLRSPRDSLTDTVTLPAGQDVLINTDNRYEGHDVLMACANLEGEDFYLYVNKNQVTVAPKTTAKPGL